MMFDALNLLCLYAIIALLMMIRGTFIFSQRKIVKQFPRFADLPASSRLMLLATLWTLVGLIWPLSLHADLRYWIDHGRWQ